MNSNREVVLHLTILERNCNSGKSKHKKKRDMARIEIAKQQEQHEKDNY